ncbi:MAG: tetratricopeptide repeat protein [Longimicrobiales bacterium]
MSAGSKPYCPECGKAATGNFCQHCGGKLGGRFCNQCGAKAGPAAMFCNQCGAKVDGGAGGHRAAAASVVGGQNLPWWIAGVAMFVLIVVVGVNMVQPGPTAPTDPAAPFAGGAATGQPPDLSTMTPREAADRLFDRVMRSASSGDSASAQAFLPMAISAYDRAQPLDYDGLFHLAMLNRVAGNLDAAIATAEQVLAAEPNHILALSEAAEAAIEQGRPDDAAGYYQRLVQAYPQEATRPLPEYQGHSNLMETARAAAEAYLAAR